MLLDNDTKIDIASSVSKVIMKQVFEKDTEFELRNYLNSIGLIELMPTNIDNFILNGNIYIIGDLQIKEHVIYQIFKELNIDKSRVHIVNEYERLKTYNFNRFQYDMQTRIIFLGPMPHSTSGKGKYSSTVAKMESEDGYPKIVKLGTEGTLKVTKTNLRDAIIKEIDTGYLDQN